MTGLIKKGDQVLLIHTDRFSRIDWKRWKKTDPYTLVPKIAWSLQQVHLIFQLDEYLFIDRHFEKNDRQYNLSLIEV